MAAIDACEDDTHSQCSSSAAAGSSTCSGSDEGGRLGSATIDGRRLGLRRSVTATQTDKATPDPRFPPICWRGNRLYYRYSPLAGVHASLLGRKLHGWVPVGWSGRQLVASAGMGGAPHAHGSVMGRAASGAASVGPPTTPRRAPQAAASVGPRTSTEGVKRSVAVPSSQPPPTVRFKDWGQPRLRPPLGVCRRENLG